MGLGAKANYNYRDGVRIIPCRTLSLSFVAPPNRDPPQERRAILQLYDATRYHTLPTPAYGLQYTDSSVTVRCINLWGAL
jgi:hypothetical protein